MKVVIDIPDKYISIDTSVKEWIDKAGNDCKVRPLPEGHGDLIDREFVRDVFIDAEMRKDYEYLGLDDVPTIIEADKTESEGEG